MRNITINTVLISVALATQTVLAIDYPYQTDEPQKIGWPLTAEERAYVVEKAEHDRRPGRESNKHLPQLWPVIPSAGYWGGTAWLDTHEKLVDYVKANPGPCDVLMVGDSITQQWGSPLDKGLLNDAWKKHFSNYKTINIGIGGDKTQNVLWRLDHGGVEGLEPRLIVLMIGNNNMFFTPETGTEPAAKGVQMCVNNLREKFANADLIVVKILPCHAPGNKFYEDIKLTNAALDPLKLDSDPRVKVLDLTSDFINGDGTIKKSLFTPDNVHLSLEGYTVYAEKLKPLLDASLGGKGLGGQVVIPAKKLSSVAPLSPSTGTEPAALDAERAWVEKGEYFRKPGHEVKKHLPEMWFVTPTAARWGNDGEDNKWVARHATCIEMVQAMRNDIDIALLGDSITQGWGGWDGAPFHAAWHKYFGNRKTVNLGI